MSPPADDLRISAIPAIPRIHSPLVDGYESDGPIMDNLSEGPDADQHRRHQQQNPQGEPSPETPSEPETSPNSHAKAKPATAQSSPLIQIPHNTTLSPSGFGSDSFTSPTERQTTDSEPVFQSQQPEPAQPTPTKEAQPDKPPTSSPPNNPSPDQFNSATPPPPPTAAAASPDSDKRPAAAAAPEPDPSPFMAAKPLSTGGGAITKEGMDWQIAFKQRYAPQVLHTNQAMAQLLAWHEQRQKAQWGASYPASVLANLWQALRHATLLGGKRFRPILVLESARSVGLTQAQATGLACAVECIHAQSLVFDDLPALDNDDLRRGQPTVHKAFDEATAILVGDALACMAFGTVAQWGPHPEDRLPPDHAMAGLELVRQLSDVASLQGLVNGQFVDIYSEATPPPSASSDPPSPPPEGAAEPNEPQPAAAWEQLRYIQANKTSALIRYCLRAPAILAGVSPTVVHQLDQVGACIGDLFQVVDDLLDVRGTMAQLGKTPGKDEVQQKLTMTTLLGVEAAHDHARQLVAQADGFLDELAPHLASADGVDGLRFLCHYGLWRLH